MPGASNGGALPMSGSAMISIAIQHEQKGMKSDKYNARPWATEDDKDSAYAQRRRRNWRRIKGGAMKTNEKSPCREKGSRGIMKR
jgi:hypothetical protein